GKAERRPAEDVRDEHDAARTARVEERAGTELSGGLGDAPERRVGIVDAALSLREIEVEIGLDDAVRPCDPQHVELRRRPDARDHGLASPIDAAVDRPRAVLDDRSDRPAVAARAPV